MQLFDQDKQHSAVPSASSDMQDTQITALTQPAQSLFALRWQYYVVLRMRYLREWICALVYPFTLFKKHRQTSKPLRYQISKAKLARDEQELAKKEQELLASTDIHEHHSITGRVGVIALLAVCIMAAGLGENKPRQATATAASLATPAVVISADRASRDKPVTASRLGPYLPKEVNADNHHYVIYADEVRMDGTISWLARNPGNIRPCVTPCQYGQVGSISAGSNGQFLIFPTEKVGMEAIGKVIRGYGDVSLQQAIGIYAPWANNNNPTAYAATVARRIGVSPSTSIKSLSSTHMHHLTQAIQQAEGWQPGKSYRLDDSRLPLGVRKVVN